MATVNYTAAEIAALDLSADVNPQLIDSFSDDDLESAASDEETEGDRVDEAVRYALAQFPNVQLSEGSIETYRLLKAMSDATGASSADIVTHALHDVVMRWTRTLDDASQASNVPATLTTTGDEPGAGRPSQGQRAETRS